MNSLNYAPHYLSLFKDCKMTAGFMQDLTNLVIFVILQMLILKDKIRILSIKNFISTEFIDTHKNIVC